MKPIKPLTAAIIAVAVGAVGFFGGMKFSQYQRASQFRNSFGGQFQQGTLRGQNGQLRNRFAGGRPVIGEIVSQDDKSITIKMMDGSSKIVILSSSTTYNKSANATKEDLKTGERVGVFGTDNADGSVTAQNIQLNPMFRGMQGQVPTQR